MSINFKHMKTSGFIISCLLFLSILFIQARIFSNKNSSNIDVISYPDEVKTVLDKSCYTCHQSTSKNIKGKTALNFDKLDKKKSLKQIGKLGKIIKKIESDKMPPKKYIEENPASALSDDDQKILIDWANDQTKMLMNN